MKTTAEKIAIMQAFLEGKQLEFVPQHHYDRWTLLMSKPEPTWDWFMFDYRVAVTKPYINPDHVHPDLEWMATDQTGATYLYTDKPTLSKDYWNSSGDCVYVEMFASFKPGTCDWKDSLVNIREELK